MTVKSRNRCGLDDQQTSSLRLEMKSAHYQCRQYLTLPVLCSFEAVCGWTLTLELLAVPFLLWCCSVTERTRATLSIPCAALRLE